MNRRVDTQTKRIREANSIINLLQKNNDTNDMLISQGSTLCENLLSPKGDDFDSRDGAIRCANQIHYSYKELKALDSSYHLSNTGSLAYKWIKLETINILDYVPDIIKEVKGNNGEVYNPEFTDIYACFAPLKKWIKPNIDKDGNYVKRGDNLQANNNFSYPDEYAKKENEEPKRKRAELQVQIDSLEDQMKHYQHLLDNLNDFTSLFFKSTYINKLSELEEKHQDLVNQRDAIKLKPETKIGYYYDDYALLQRNIRKVHGEPLRIITGTSVHKGKWGKISTENTYETIVKEVIDEERETKTEPLLPSPLDFKNFVAKDDYSNEGCLLKDINSLKEIKKVYDKNEDAPEYYNKLSLSENDLKENKSIIINENVMTTDDAYLLYSEVPEYFYFENDDKTFMLAKVIDKKITLTNPIIKTSYEERYGRATEAVKYFVYDEKLFGNFYKDHKYNVQITIALDYSNLSDKDKKIVPSLRISNDTYIEICEKYKRLIINDIKAAKDIFEEAPEETRCIDFEPVERYNEFYNYLNELPLPNNTQCNMFIDYCINNILKWVNNRIPALVNTTTDIKNAEDLITLLLKRIRKNTGSLLIWYQTVLSFDNTYIENLLNKQLIHNSSQYMLVTKGYDGNNDKLFNKQLYPKYIDIQDIDKEYGNIKFNVGDKIYILKDPKEQQNTITSIETIYIEEADPLDPMGKTIKVPVTRLHLRSKLLKWCKTEEPSNIIVSKLL